VGSLLFECVFPVQNVSDRMRLKALSVPCIRYTCILHVFLYLNWLWTVTHIIIGISKLKSFWSENSLSTLCYSPVSDMSGALIGQCDTAISRAIIVEYQKYLWL
jgi:hypothetical protein